MAGLLAVQLRWAAETSPKSLTNCWTNLHKIASAAPAGSIATIADALGALSDSCPAALQKVLLHLADGIAADLGTAQSSRSAAAAAHASGTAAAEWRLQVLAAAVVKVGDGKLAAFILQVLCWCGGIVARSLSDAEQNRTANT
jgi:hypothetical protein